MEMESLDIYLCSNMNFLDAEDTSDNNSITRNNFVTQISVKNRNMKQVQICLSTKILRCRLTSHSTDEGDVQLLLEG